MFRKINRFFQKKINFITPYLIDRSLKRIILTQADTQLQKVEDFITQMKNGNDSIELFDWIYFKEKMKNKPDIAYIIAPGGSVLDIGAQNIFDIQKSFVISFNASLYFPIVPDVYFFEIANNSKLSELHHLALAQLARENWRKTTIIFKNLWEEKNDPKVLQSSPVLDSIKLLRDVHLPDFESEFLFRKALRLLNEDLLNPNKFFYQIRSSLFLCIVFCYALGFKKIVLLGADLVNSNYFYSLRPEIVPECIKRYLFFQENKQVHDTASERSRWLSIQKIIFVLDSVVLRPNGVTLYIGSNTSALAKQLPVWSFY